LKSAVEEFIHTGKPVTSEHLFRAFDFGIKPAMIRWELNNLTGDNFFFQEHPSGGRFPTNKAYRCYVEWMQEEAQEARTSFLRLAHTLLGRTPRTLVDEVADYLGVFSVGYAPQADYVYESGLDELVGELDLEDRGELLVVMRDISLLPERLMAQRAWWSEEVWPQVFVGQNPLTKSTHLSVIVGKVAHNGKPLLISAVGPTRMDYEKSLRLFRALCQ